MTSNATTLTQPILRTVNLSQVSSRPVEWLWPGRVPRGKLTMLTGDPGLGKSFLTMDMAARLSCGREWPDGAPGGGGSGRPASVLVISAEDDPGDTIRPRIEACAGDASRIECVQGLVIGSDAHGLVESDLSVREDASSIERRLATMDNPALVIIDPISAYLGEVDSHNNAQVRSTLKALSDLAARTGVAIVCVNHLNKAAGGRAVYRQMGSLAFTAAARVVWQVVKDPADEDKRVLVLVKANLACTTNGLSFEIAGTEHAAHVRWLGHASVSADDCEDPIKSEQAGALPEAEEFLRGELSAGARPAEEIIARSAALGINLTTLKRAKRNIGAVSRKNASMDSAWVWSLKESENDQPAKRAEPPRRSRPKGVKPGPRG